MAKQEEEKKRETTHYKLFKIVMKSTITITITSISLSCSHGQEIHC